jgi:Protein of unknown function (DUF2865)
MMILRPFRTIALAVLVLAAASANVAAQNVPPAGAPGQNPGQSPVCTRLEAQLASIDRGDPTRADQVRRYEEALQAQQGELDRTVALAKRNGCEGSGFFLFGRSQAPQCDDLNNRIQRMRANVDRLTTDLQQLRGGISVEGQRRQVLMALGQYQCGPQYRSAEAPPAQPSGPRGFFQSLFGGGGGGGGGGSGSNANAPFGAGDLTPSDQSSSYRTICVRTCDGYFFPVSYSTSQARFRDDEQACQRMCPASEVQLFTYRNPGEDVAQAVSISGQSYSSLTNAFRYRQEFNAACSCKRPGESWSEALKHLDDTTVERGDIVVTEETAKALSQPKPEAPPRGAKQTPKGKNEPRPSTPPGPASAGATPAPVSSEPLPQATQPAPEQAPAAAAPAAEPGKKQIRTVGPPFIVR